MGRPRIGCAHRVGVRATGSAETIGNPAIAGSATHGQSRRRGAADQGRALRPFSFGEVLKCSSTRLCNGGLIIPAPCHEVTYWTLQNGLFPKEDQNGPPFNQ